MNNIKFILRDTWVAIPSFFIALYFLMRFAGNIIEYFLCPFFGKWAFIISLPITWPYIYSPLMDIICDFFFENDKN
jgi:hypothetical protein